MKKDLSLLQDNRLIVCIVMIFLLFESSGCSVFMAASGKKGTDLSQVAVGKTKQEVEEQLGKPLEVGELNNGKRISVYEYDAGRKPSTGRAVVHGVADVFTVGLWEVVGTPYEATKKKYNKLQIIYDSEDIVIVIRELY